jgi:hypothetical protein
MIYFFPSWHIPNKGEVEMAVHEFLRVEESDFYQDQILQTRANRRKMH